MVCQLDLVKWPMDRKLTNFEDPDQITPNCSPIWVC